jgi:hypothetical protein
VTGDLLTQAKALAVYRVVFQVSTMLLPKIDHFFITRYSRQRISRYNDLIWTY